MGRIVIELTNRCNLSCTHCFEGRHSADGNLGIEIIEKIISQAKAHGFNHLSFTGGDPTIHPRFIEIIQKSSLHGYDFSFVTNGQNFDRIYTKLLPLPKGLTEVTFSLDGARESTNDSLRGSGTYRRVMKAVSLCVYKDIPFTFNMVITLHNRNEIGEMAELTAKLGSRGLALCHLMPTALTTAQNLDLSPEQRRETEREIWKIQKGSSVPVVMAPGYYTADLFPCAPLRMQELNIDWKGNMTKCCHLSSRGGGAGSTDIIGNLDQMSFAEAYGELVRANERFRSEKLERHSQGGFLPTDYFPCWYCENYFLKADWIRNRQNNPWSAGVWNNTDKRRPYA